MLTLEEIGHRLAAHPARVVDPGAHRHAAVALVLCEAPWGLDVLFIERSHHEQDPWSGHVGFPGGRVEEGDSGPRAAAERETFEEVGLDLATAAYLGRLDDLLGTHVPIVVSCFVFGLGAKPGLSPNPAEVRQAFWLPLAELLDRGRHGEKTSLFQGEVVSYPAIRVLGEGSPWLWGITYRLLWQFLEAAGLPL